MPKDLLLVANLRNNWAVGKNPKQRLFDLAQSAIDCGVDAVQVHVFDRLYREPERQKAADQYRLPPSWLPELKAHIGNTKLVVAPYHREAEHIIESADIIALDSFNLNHPGIVEYCSGIHKPLHISVCATDMEEIDDIIEKVRPGDEAPKDVTLLHHPVGKTALDLNLRRLLDLGQHFFPLPTGFQVEMNVPHLVASSVLYRIGVINVLFDGADGAGIESKHSFNSITLPQLTRTIEEFTQAMTCGCVWPLVDELARANNRRDPSDWLRPLKM